MTDTALQQKVARNIHPETSTQVYFPTPDPRSKWRRSIFTYKYIEVPIHVHDVRDRVCVSAAICEGAESAVGSGAVVCGCCAGALRAGSH
jgi:hypothetical protein